TKKKREPGTVGQTLGQTHFHARPVRRAAFTAAQRCGQCTTGIENEQVACAKVIADLIEAGVFDAARRAFDHQQSHLVTTNSATFRRLLRTKLRRKCECEPRAHYSNFTAFADSSAFQSSCA